jgi:hypothetical protein
MTVNPVLERAIPVWKSLFQIVECSLPSENDFLGKPRKFLPGGKTQSSRRKTFSAGLEVIPAEK